MRWSSKSKGLSGTSLALAVGAVGIAGVFSTGCSSEKIERETIGAAVEAAEEAAADVGKEAEEAQRREEARAEERRVAAARLAREEQERQAVGQPPSWALGTLDPSSNTTQPGSSFAQSNPGQTNPNTTPVSASQNSRVSKPVQPVVSRPTRPPGWQARACGRG
jgi:hypothetical protein